MSAEKILVVTHSNNENSKISFLINFLPDDYSISLEEEIKLKRYLDSITIAKIKKIEITGFTDSDGSDEYNQKLSLNRAQEVFNYMRSYGIQTSKVVIKGLGESSSTKSNVTAEGKKRTEESRLS